MKSTFIFSLIIIPFLSFTQIIKVSTNGFWNDENGLNQKIISGIIKIDNLSINEYQRTRISKATAYFSDGSTSNIEYEFDYDIGNKENETYLTFSAPKTNSIIIDSIVGKIDYFTPTIKNKSILKTKFSKKTFNKDLVKNKYPIKIIPLDVKQILGIKKENIKIQKNFFRNLIETNKIEIENLDYFVEHFFDNFPITNSDENDFLFLISDFSYEKFNNIKILTNNNSMIRICSETHFSKKKCTWWYSKICESDDKIDEIPYFEIALFFENKKDIKTYDFKIENIIIQSMD